MDFKEAESKYFELKGRLSARALTLEQFQAEVAELRVQDNEGRHWAVDSRTGGWLLYDGAKWVPAQPPGSVAVPPPPPAAAAPPRGGGGSPILLIGALVATAVLCLVALGGAGLILSRSGGESGSVGEASAVSQEEAEAIADDIISKQFPHMEGAEKVIGGYQNPAGTKFWTVTYSQDAQVEFEGLTYGIPNVVVVSVDQDTGEAIVAVSS